jgi:hypothetical protein
VPIAETIPTVVAPENAIEVLAPAPGGGERQVAARLPVVQRVAFLQLGAEQRVGVSQVASLQEVVDEAHGERPHDRFSPCARESGGRGLRRHEWRRGRRRVERGRVRRNAHAVRGATMTRQQREHGKYERDDAEDTGQPREAAASSWGAQQ